MSSKMLSLLLSGASEIHVELLPLPFGMNENFPVVGDGCACGGKESKLNEQDPPPPPPPLPSTTATTKNTNFTNPPRIFSLSLFPPPYKMSKWNLFLKN
ncbi:hypothetical protein CUMW_031010 [Citrus unshiu]|nr:hypothetical protein CUMW_031010 [Citrus unshiu]